VTDNRKGNISHLYIQLIIDLRKALDSMHRGQRYAMELSYYR